jgi:type I restriction enzyme R subunit
LFEGKEQGFIIDYVGLFGKLNEALNEYSALEGFDEEDLTGTIVDILEEISKNPARHSDVWDIFKSVNNKKDIEALERCVAEKDIRDKFYSRLSNFAKVLHTALSSDEFYNEFSDKDISFYKSELKFFIKMKRSVQVRYAEVVDYREYEEKIRKLLDTYVQVEDVYSVIDEINIFDKNLVQEQLEEYGQSTASKADMIASKMKKIITEKMEQDEAFYKKFSELIEQTIKDFREDRIDEKKYLDKILEIKDNFTSGVQDGVPEILHNNEKARAFFGAVKEVLKSRIESEQLSAINDKLAVVGFDISEIIEKLTIRDWKQNLDIQRQMENDIEDYLLTKRKELGVEISFDEIDEVLVKCLKVAKHNY